MRLGDEGSGTITIAAAADVGEAQTEVEAAIEGDTVQISFNARYLQDALQSLDQDQLALEFGSALPGRPQADNVRRGLRPRHHAGPHALLIRGSNFMLDRWQRRRRVVPDTHDARHPSRWSRFASYAELDVEFPGPQVVADPMPPARPTSSRAWSSSTARPLPPSRWTAS